MAIFQVEPVTQVDSIEANILNIVALEQEIVPIFLNPNLAQDTFSYWIMLILSIWLIGVVVLIGNLLVGFWGTKRIARNSTLIDNQVLTSLLEQLCSKLCIRRPVTLFHINKPIMPITWGWLRPVIMLPDKFASWTIERQRVILLHELAHIKRKDYLTQIMARITCAIFWFNPLVWFAFRQIRKERELACDDYVLILGTKASDYATHLLELTQSQLTTQWSSVASVAMATPSEIENRLLAVLQPTHRRVYTTAATMVMSLAITTVVLTFGIVNPMALPHNVEQLLSDSKEKAPQEREEAVRALGFLGDNSQVITPLINALTDKDSQVREWAARSLGYRKADGAVETLISALKDEDSQVREASAWALGQIGNHQASIALISATQDEDAQVREHAERALKNLSPP